MLDASTELFELPLEAKNRPNCGYIPRSTLYPLFESLSIEETTIPESVDGFTKALWPENNPAFSETVVSYSLKLSELDQMIRRMVLESLEVEQYTDEHLQSAKYIVRVNRYDGPKTEETMMMALPHTDKNFITILHQNQVGGLQIQTKGGQWTDASFSPNSYIVMVGDSLHAWTNGRVHAPLHQVVLSGNETRYSLGLFSVPKVGCTIKAPEELVDDEHPLLFKPFDYYEYLTFFRTEVRFKNPVSSEDVLWHPNLKTNYSVPLYNNDKEKLTRFPSLFFVLFIVFNIDSYY